MQKTILILLILSGCALIRNESRVSNHGRWKKYINTEESGFEEKKLRLAHDFFNELNSPALLVTHKGKVSFCWGDCERRFMIHSIWKSIMNPVYGQYSYQGKLDLKKTLSEIGIDDKEGLSQIEKSATVSNLLQARSGVYHPTFHETPEMRKYKPKRWSKRPGEKWVYNNWDFHALKTIFEKETGRQLISSIEELFKEIDFEDYESTHVKEVHNKDVSFHSSLQLRLSSRDLARIGQLYLDKGLWDGKRFFSEKWVDKSWQSHTLKESSKWKEWIGDYGLLWWSFDVNGVKTYSAAGVGTQFLTVIPSKKMVVVFRVDSYRDQKIHPNKFKKLLSLLLDSHDPKLENPTAKYEYAFKNNEGKKSYLLDLPLKFLGKYQSKYGTHEIVKKNGRLQVDGPIGVYSILKSSKENYSLEDIRMDLFFKKSPQKEKKLDFIFNKNGEISSLFFYY